MLSSRCRYPGARFPLHLSLLLTGASTHRWGGSGYQEVACVAERHRRGIIQLRSEHDENEHRPAMPTARLQGGGNCFQQRVEKALGTDSTSEI